MVLNLYKGGRSRPSAVLLPHTRCAALLPGLQGLKGKCLFFAHKPGLPSCPAPAPCPCSGCLCHMPSQAIPAAVQDANTSSASEILCRHNFPPPKQLFLHSHSRFISAEPVSLCAAGPMYCHILYHRDSHYLGHCIVNRWGMRPPHSELPVGPSSLCPIKEHKQSLEVMHAVRESAGERDLGTPSTTHSK